MVSMDGEFYLQCHSCLHCFKDSHCHGVLNLNCEMRGKRVHSKPMTVYDLLRIHDEHT